MTGHPEDHRKLWLAQLVNDNNFTLGAELGVHEGVTHFHLLDHCPQLTMIGVDLYQRNQQHLYEKFAEQLGTYGNRSIFYRESTFTAHKYVDDQSLDFVFIDADHSTAAVTKDITNWSPKVKSGGYIIGHDYNKSAVKKAVENTLGKVKPGPDQIWYYKK